MLRIGRKCCDKEPRLEFQEFFEKHRNTTSQNSISVNGLFLSSYRTVNLQLSSFQIVPHPPRTIGSHLAIASPPRNTHTFKDLLGIQFAETSSRLTRRLFVSARTSPSRATFGPFVGGGRGGGSNRENAVTHAYIIVNQRRGARGPRFNRIRKVLCVCRNWTGYVGRGTLTYIAPAVSLFCAADSSIHYMDFSGAISARGNVFG